MDLSAPAPGGTWVDDRIYLDGNSLGALAPGVAGRLSEAVDVEWKGHLARGWDECGWMDAPERVGDRIAPLIGARAGEVLVCDTTSIALAKLLGAVLRARPSRGVVVTSTDNFPSDLYVADAVTASVPGAELRVVEPASLVQAIREAGASLAATYLTQVDFRTGELHDLPGLTRRAHETGALAIWDLCHSAGVVEVGCEANALDLAVGCTYKYLNGGPGAPSFLYVRRELQAELENPLPGWLGHASPFSFEREWRPAEGMRRWLTSTPPVLALAALEAALEAFDGHTIAELRERSVALGELFIATVDELAPAGLSLASPRDPGRRGSQVSLRCEGPLAGSADRLAAESARRGVIGDVRPPDLCRFGLSPLYLSFEQVATAAEIVCDAAAAIGRAAG